MKLLSLFWGVLLATLAVSCSQQPSAEKKADNQEQKAEAPVQTCELKFEEKYTDAQKENKSVSVYVSNFDGEASGPCWKNVEEYAGGVKTEPGKTTQVFFFNCPHHTTKVSAADFKLEGEYKDYCVARLDVSPDGKKSFVKLPYDPKNS